MPRVASERENLVWFGIHLTESKESRQEVESPVETRLGGRTKAPEPALSPTQGHSRLLFDTSAQGKVLLPGNLFMQSQFTTEHVLRVVAAR